MITSVFAKVSISFWVNREKHVLSASQQVTTQQRNVCVFEEKCYYCQDFCVLQPGRKKLSILSYLAIKDIKICAEMMISRKTLSLHLLRPPDGLLRLRWWYANGSQLTIIKVLVVMVMLIAKEKWQRKHITDKIYCGLYCDCHSVVVSKTSNQNHKNWYHHKLNRFAAAAMVIN